MADKGRYDNPPISEETKKGMVLTIDDIAAISRLLSLQDDYYEEMFDKLSGQLEGIQKILKNHEKRIACVERKLEAHLLNHQKEIA